MRMWMVEPRLMCDRHLLGEHAETHMLEGSLRRKRSIAGFIERDLLEPAGVRARHDELAAEMAGRGFRHSSAMPESDLSHLPREHAGHRVDVARASAELKSRCPRCASRARRLEGSK